MWLDYTVVICPSLIKLSNSNKMDKGHHIFYVVYVLAADSTMF